MWDLIKMAGFWTNIIICIAGISVAYLWVIDWLIGQLLRYFDAYKLFVDFAWYRKDFSKWRELRRIRAVRRLSR